ncbi:chromosome segregation SMC family protein [Methylocella silvestris]|uniref:Chromosome partition protein Smc n=1 Tax=Methylocella silvestris TaxID=199596 RepID=A0A2J7TM59_METSI|nr:chromosome segregation SMC family protein [Methylocella silvestris]PNG27844.1 chromosome segregation protein SMC [Methylocella silvestris]
MKFTKLRIAGFKTFVDPTDFLIEPGLTGVVGPNGCGKSNLVEAMRWAMGESSSKNMRASGMDDVIFSGGGNRPARNMAEVVLYLDNSARTAPAAFNDSDAIEVSRRIERESGSTYRVNGRETRARDVQLLFADASSGSRSPAMVRQGQIGEMISAKPQERRRILEEAAGVAGLHSRRHEAELRLKAAADNLQRLDDILQQIEGQTRGLERQARQAARYRDLAGSIRRAEALLALIHHKEAAQSLAEAEASFEIFTREVEERTKAQAEAARTQGLAAHALPALRDAELAASGELQRLIIAREALDGEEKRAKARSAELSRRIEQMSGDLARERALIADAAGVLERLDLEQAELSGSAGAEGSFESETRKRLVEAEAALAAMEAELAAAQDARALIEARRSGFETTLRDERQRLARIEADLARVLDERAALELQEGSGGESAPLLEELEAAIEKAAAFEDEIAALEGAHADARASEASARQRAMDADRKAQRLGAETQTLSKLLNARSGDFWPAVTEEITVARGFEAALGAALGDDLDASTNPSAPAHWAETDRRFDPALPDGCEPLCELVQAPQALARRLNQIGLVTREDGRRLRAALKPGQRLVSKEGDLWRWDGFFQAAEAPTPAARRLVEKNRLGDLIIEADSARELADSLKAEADSCEALLAAAAAAETEARQGHKTALRDVDAARAKHAAAERAEASAAARMSSIEEAMQRLSAARDEGRENYANAQSSLDDLADAAELTERLELCRAGAARERAVASEARAALQAHLREGEARARRLEAIARERTSWLARSEGSGGQISAFETRLAEAQEEFERLAEAPDVFLSSRRTLVGAIETAEAARKEAADRRAEAETALAAADKAARIALDAMSAAREQKARAETRIEAARTRREEVARQISAELDCGPEELSALAKLGAGEDLPPATDVERRLEALKADRERLGAVNLRAEEELNEAETEKARLAAEHADLTEAIRRLRQAIASLNKEGRERLLAAFTKVNAHFTELFTSLFGGGSAELQLVESDDPLEAGLEILARPPGKKPQVMTLLSGGEQALTAMSLIFAIFLTNPSPICVLDEVDAPLDDANVERFCDLLQEMRGKTETRFITITHNPITMARMNRLFGVTMAERGVSQLVSVDLEDAERLLEAG